MHETSQVLLEACEILLEARNFLKTVTAEFSKVLNGEDELFSRYFNVTKEETNVSRTSL